MNWYNDFSYILYIVETHVSLSATQYTILEGHDLNFTVRMDFPLEFIDIISIIVGPSNNSNSGIICFCYDDMWPGLTKPVLLPMTERPIFLTQNTKLHSFAIISECFKPLVAHN